MIAEREHLERVHHKPVRNIYIETFVWYNLEKERRKSKKQEFLIARQTDQTEDAYHFDVFNSRTFSDHMCTTSFMYYTGADFKHRK